MNSIYSLSFVFAGAALLFHSSPQVQGDFRRGLNVFELKESPYGEVVGAALQEPVSTLYHNGLGHHHEHGGDSCATCSDCDDTGEERCELNPIQRWKDALLTLGTKIRLNHSPIKGGSGFGQKQGLDVVLFAYEVDPTNYGNYAIKTYYLGSSSLGGDGMEARWQSVFDLAERTIEVCERRSNNLSDALTAASAEELMLIYKTKMKEKLGENVIKQHYLSFSQRVKHFKSLMQQARDSGEINNYSEVRVKELEERSARFEYNLNGYRDWF